MSQANRVRGALLLGVSACAWSAAHAQTAVSASATPPPQQANQLSEVIVTANRRSENIQKAPLAVTALSGAQLSTRSIQTSMDLQQATPGLTFSDNANFSEPYIRGVGTDLTTPGGESSVATYVDGVYQADPYFGVQSLVAIDRVEVLQGPQGTLYGRNATGGVINIKTRDPSPEFNADATVSVGNYAGVNAVGYISIPLTNTLWANLAVGENRHDGYGTVLNTGRDFNALDQQYVRAKVLYQPSNNFSVLASGQLLNSYDTSSGYTYFTKFGASPVAPLEGGLVTIDSQNIYSAYPFKDFTRGEQFSLKATYKWNGLKITSLTAYDNVDGHIFPDFVSTNIPIFDFNAHDDIDTDYLEELTVAQDTSHVSWIAGFSYFHDSAKFDPDTTYSGTTPNASIFATVDTISFAGFGELTYRFNNRFSITGGIRYTSDTKEQAELAFGDGAGNIFLTTPFSQRVFNDETYKAVLQYTPDWGTLYAKFETGFKAGGVNALAAADYVAPEQLKSYEVGAKSDLFDHRLRLNADAFYYDYSNLQSQYTDVATGAAYFETAKKATVYGGEVTAEAIVTDQLTLSGAINLLHTRFDDYISNGSDAVIGGYDTPVPGLNLTGNHLTHSPPVTANLGADWRLPLADGGNVTTSIQYYYSAKYFFDVTNRIYQTPLSLVNGRVTWNLADHKSSFGVWVRNLTNQSYIASATFGAFGDYGELAPPRTFGVTISRKF